jgi:glycosyltransferase involved in cell wall biosynthesis
MTSAPSIAYLLPDPGIPVGGTKGASVHVESLCCALARAGASVTLYAARVTGPLRSAGSDRVQVVPVDVGAVRSGPAGEASRTTASQRFFATVGEQLGRQRPDWVQERLTLFAGQGTEVCSALGLERVVEVNAPVAAERARHFGLQLVEEADQAERQALAGARVLAVSEPLVGWAMAKGAAEGEVLPNGADTATLSPGRWAGHGRQLRRQAGMGERVVIGFAGSLKPWHGVELLVDAVATARAANPGQPLGLLVVGDGPQRPQVEEALGRLPDDVKAVLTGAVPFAEMPAYLAAMDICAAPYLPNEDFYFSPLKVAEAMAAGRAVVAADFPPVRQLLDGTGELFPPGDLAALARLLADLSADPHRRAMLGRQARLSAVERLDWGAVARRTMQFAGAAMSAAPSGAPAA